MPISALRNLSKPQRNAPRRPLSYEIPIFKGWHPSYDTTAIEEYQSPDTLNTVYDTVESVGSRKGYTKVLTTATPSFIGGIQPLYRTDGTKQLVYASNTNLYRYDNAGGSVQLTPNTGAPTNFTANLQWSFDEYLDQLYGGNGTDSFISYNGTNYSVVNNGVTPQFVKVRNNRVYCANKNSSTIYFSDAGNPNSFPVNNFIQINTNDGQNISGIAELLGNLVIFKDNSIWILSGEPLGAGNTTTIGNLQLQRANSPVGCSAFRTIQVVDQALFFMHSSGLWALQNLSATLVSPALDPVFFNGMNPGFVNLCWGLYSAAEKKYLLGYPSSTSTTCDRVIVYDFSVKDFSYWDDMPGSCAVNYRFSGLTDNILMGDANRGNIYEMMQGYADIAGDNGTATGGSTTTLVDSTKTWLTDQFKDCRIKVITSLNTGYVARVTSNTSNTLTFTPAIPTPPTGNDYTIGYYDSYWTTKDFDFQAPGNVKKYRFFSLFADSALYSILFGYSIDFAPLSYSKSIPLSKGLYTWNPTLYQWGQAGLTWGTYSSTFVQAAVAGNGRYIKARFGTNKANQPWRAIMCSFEYKLKKKRPNIVAV